MDNDAETWFLIKVGGVDFHSTKSTLLKSKFFQKLFLKDEGQTLFLVDRSPRAFKHILDHLRDFSYKIPDKWNKEAQFYEIQYPKPSVDDQEDKEETGSEIFTVNNLHRLQEVFRYIDCYNKDIKFSRFWFTLSLDRERFNGQKNQSIFKIPRYLDLKYIIYDFIQGPIKRGRIHNGGHDSLCELNSYNTCPQIPCNTFQPITIVMDGDIDRLSVAVSQNRTWKSSDAKDLEYYDPAHNISYSKGMLNKVFYPVPIWADLKRISQIMDSEKLRKGEYDNDLHHRLS